MASGTSAHKSAALPARSGRSISSIRSQPASANAPRHRDRVVAGQPAVESSLSRRRAPTSVFLPATPRASPVHLERKAQAAFERAAVFVRPFIGEGGEEARQEVAVCGVKLDHVEAGKRRAPPMHEIGDHSCSCRRGSSRAELAEGRVGQGDATGSFIAILLQRLVLAFPGQLGRPLSPGMAELKADLSREFAWTKSTMRFQAASCASL